MQEIEVKILEIDQGALEKKLLALGAEKHFEGELHAIFYDFEDASIKERGSVLRLRKEGSETKLTFKSPVSRDEAKIMNEYESGVEDMEAVQKILSHLSLKKAKETRKWRIEYLFGDCKVVIDDYQDDLAYIPVFMEVEAPDLATMKAVVRRLGYKIEDCKSWSTYELVEHYGELL